MIKLHKLVTTYWLNRTGVGMAANLDDSHDEDFYSEIYEVAGALAAAAAVLAATPQGKQMLELMRQLRENPPQSISLSLEDQAAWNNAFEHPEGYTHLHPVGTALADVAFTEMDIIETVAWATGSIEEPPETLSPEVVEWLDKAFPASNYTPATYDDILPPEV
jgi:hypothetical protein